MTRRHLRRLVAASGVSLALAWLAPAARAVDAGAYVLFPNVIEGEREIDWRCGVGSAGERTTLERNCGIGFGMGLTQHWFSEIALQYRRVGIESTAFDAVEWENIFQLAEPGEWPVDVGLALEIERPRDLAEGPAVRFGPLFQKEIGRFQANFNVLFGRHYRTTALATVQVRYQGQVKYRYSQPLEFGLQAFGNLGDRSQSWSAYGQQIHRIGPAVMGKFPLGNERSVSYNAGFLAGTTGRSPDRTLRLQIEYEF